MSHIFLSYASVDRERARQVAGLLSEFGWKVWWDRTIPPGRQFDDIIEEALDAAACVVVLWSKASIASTWVKTEAAEANRRKVLIPVLIEEVKIPLEFRRVQAADLAAWQGDQAHPEIDKLIAAIANEIGRPGSPRSGEHAPGGATREPPPSQQPPSAPAPAPAPIPSLSPSPPPSPAPAAVPAQRLLEARAAPAGTSAGLKWGVAGAVPVLLIGGFFWYQSAEQSRQRELQAEHQRQDLERKLDEERRNAEADRARREKEAADQAARERAARDLLAQERAARDAAEREAARRRAADEAAVQARARQAEEASARRPDTTPARGATAGSPSTFTAPLTWRDHVLTYSGVLTWDNTSATLRAVINDINTGQTIGRYTVPARVSARSQNEYFIQAEFAIPGDSTTPGPHTHQVGLIVRPQSDGTLRLVQNCPQPGRCF